MEYAGIDKLIVGRGTGFPIATEKLDLKSDKTPKFAK
jgi:hypothetical protein